MGRRRHRRPAGRLPGRLPQLRHDLRARLGTGTGARAQPRLRRRPAPHAASADRFPRPRHLAVRRSADHGDDDRRLHLPRPDRLLRLPPGDGLVRQMDRRPRRGHRPHPGAVPLQRPARLRRPPLHRLLPRRPICGGAQAAGGLAGAGAPGPRGPAETRGLGLRDRLLALAGLRHPPRGPRRPARQAGGRPAIAGWWSGMARGALDEGARLARAAGARRDHHLGPLRRDHHRQPALLADRHAGNGRIAEAADGAGRPHRLRPAPARRSDAVAGDDRRLRRPRARLHLPPPPLGPRHRRRRPRPARLRLPRRGGPGDHRPLHDARRGDPLDLLRPRPARLAPGRQVEPLPPLVAGLRRRRPR